MNKLLKFKRLYTIEGVSPFDQFEYKIVDSVITNPSGEVVCEFKNAEVPLNWSQTACDILVQKYFRRTGVNGDVGETSIKQVAHRLANCWRVWGERYGYFDSENGKIFYDEVVYMILAQIAAPNSPQFFNTGLFESYNIKGNSDSHYYVCPKTEQLMVAEDAYSRPQTSACFILSVKDDLFNEGGIFDLVKTEAKIFKFGSGVGTNFSTIRAEGEPVSGGGSSSGVLSFLKINDRAASSVKSGGTTRRAAKMVILDADHPDIEAFIDWKAKEELKAKSLIEAGYPSGYEDEAYQTVSGQNSNNSVRISDDFIKSVDSDLDWNLTRRVDGKIVKTLKASYIWDKIANAAWSCADPGVQFSTTINDWHTCKNSGEIRASNPCSEYLFLDNTACNLASLNLIKFTKDKTINTFDVNSYLHAINIWTVVLELSVLMASYPTKEVALGSYNYRTLGLGYANLGALLMCSGLPYDCDKSRHITSCLTAILTGGAYATSARMAEVVGPFKHYEMNIESMLDVIKNHKRVIDGDVTNTNIRIKLSIDSAPAFLKDAAKAVWEDALSLGLLHGYRNAQVSVLAPTGTIGLLMDCDTTGIEPDFSLIKFKKLSGGGYFKIVNNSVEVALRSLGYSESQILDIQKYIKGHNSLESTPHINLSTLPDIFTNEEKQKLEVAAKTAFSIESLFSPYVLGFDFFQKLGIDTSTPERLGYDLLHNKLGFSDDEIDLANRFLVGFMTIEGAPHVKPEHYSVFHCANKCGDLGEGFILPLGHIKMMAAAQPFISGAISKTVNLPNTATIEDVKNAYYEAWRLGVKALSVYRDGCKSSQPLSSKSRNNDSAKGSKINLETEDGAQSLISFIRESVANNSNKDLINQIKHILGGFKNKLPAKRYGFNQRAEINGQTIYVRTGDYPDGSLGELFIDIHKEGATLRSLLNCFAIAVSMGLQHGVPLSAFVDKFTFTRFEPSGFVSGHENIKNCTSIIDYVFRLLAFEYLGASDLVQVKPENDYSRVSTNSCEKKNFNTLKNNFNEVNRSFMEDAPTCNICGYITIRNAACYKCLNCGNSVGCS